MIVSVPDHCLSFYSFWFKIVHTEERRYINCTYNMMLNDIELRPNKQNRASMVKHLLSRLGFWKFGMLRGWEI